MKIILASKSGVRKKILDKYKINFTLFTEYFESAFVNNENDFSSTSTF